MIAFVNTAIGIIMMALFALATLALSLVLGINMFDPAIFVFVFPFYQVLTSFGHPSAASSGVGRSSWTVNGNQSLGLSLQSA